MKKSLLLIALLFTLSQISFGQARQELVGKWKVVTVKDAFSFYDVKKDSISIFNYGEGAGKMTQQAKDSLYRFSKNYMQRNFRNSYFVFKKDGNYEKRRGNLILSKGVYFIDESIQTIKLGNSISSPTLKYSLKKGLWLFELDGLYEFDLERS